MGDSFPILPTLFFFQIWQSPILGLVVMFFSLFFSGKQSNLLNDSCSSTLLYSLFKYQMVFFFKAESSYAQEISLMICPLAYIYLFISMWINKINKAPLNICSRTLHKQRFFIAFFKYHVQSLILKCLLSDF